MKPLWPHHPLFLTTHQFHDFIFILLEELPSPLGKICELDINVLFVKSPAPFSKHISSMYPWKSCNLLPILCIEVHKLKSKAEAVTFSTLVLGHLQLKLTSTGSSWNSLESWSFFPCTLFWQLMNSSLEQYPIHDLSIISSHVIYKMRIPYNTSSCLLAESDTGTQCIIFWGKLSVSKKPKMILLKALKIIPTSGFQKWSREIAHPYLISLWRRMLSGPIAFMIISHQKLQQQCCFSLTCPCWVRM